ncbi:hypothetical protein ACHAQA_007479 [Verticillium albo-atrum]
MPSSGVSSGLSKLTLDNPKSKSKAKAKKPVADSWEDEDDDDSSASDSEAPAPPATDSGAKAPPPTPISPTHQSSGSTRQWASMGGGASDAGPRSPLSPDSERRRPEKTDAVARRMIAGALGVKAPKMTEEQRAYEKSVREQERKRRDAEREREKREREEAERAKLAVWED